jgi:hypothetical protein
VSGHDDGERFPTGMPERRLDPREDDYSQRDRRHVCGCGRGCVSWPDHFARVEADRAREDKADVADEREARLDRWEAAQ